MSLPLSSSSFTVEVCPFIAASMRGDIPNLLPVLRTYKNTHKTTPIQPHPHNAPRVDICPFLEQQFDDVHVPPRGSQGEWSVIRDIPMLKVGPLGQQKLDNLTRSAKM